MLPPTFAGALAAPSPCAASGWADLFRVPARTAGLAGAAQGGVDDAAATYLNPAGLSGIDRVQVLGGAALRFGQLGFEPDAASSSSSAFLEVGGAAAGAGRLSDWIVVAAAISPVAVWSRGVAGPSSEDQLSLQAYELSPAVALQVPDDALPGDLAFGLGYRVTLASIHRERSGTGAELDAQGLGLDATGLRLGLQYSPIAEMRLGLSLQSPVGVTVQDQRGTLTGATPSERVVARWRLPWVFAAGIRADLDRYGLAFDYRFTPPSEPAPLKLEDAQQTVEFAEGVDWGEGHRVQLGLEARVSLRRRELPLRLGYAFDVGLSDPAAAVAWQTPGSSQHALTAGWGLVNRKWQSNLAVFYGWSSAQLEDQASCPTCLSSGQFSAWTLGLSLDGSFELD